MKKITLIFLLIFTTLNNTKAAYLCPEPYPAYFASFERNVHNCQIGYYLPANTDECIVCPTGATCVGGTYIFNENKFQGIEINEYINTTLNKACAANFSHAWRAIYEANLHTCEPGYYLPAGVDSCTICPQNNKCAGGTYYFNETINQGIEQCANPTPFAPAGSTICYPHVLHIGDDMVYLKSTKLTTPSLNVGMDDGIFYANMTTVPTPMNASTEHYLKIEYDGMIYYVCDDSTYGQ